MTGLRTLPERIQLNPDVPFPPFPLWLRLPDAWSLLDSNPGTWRRSAQQLIDTAFRGSRLASSERRDVLAVLEGLVADCQRAGAALSLLTVGRRAAGGAASFGLHCAFASDGRPSSVGRVHDILPRTGVAAVLQTAAGPAVAHRDRMTMVVPGSGQLVALTSLQIFVPLPGTSWTVVLSTASAYPELTDALEQTLRAVAESIRTDAPESSGLDGQGLDAAGLDATGLDAAGLDTTGLDTTGLDAAGLDADRSGPSGTAAPVGTSGRAGGISRAGGGGGISRAGGAGAPGFERGFGTVVERRIDPPRPAGPGR